MAELECRSIGVRFGGLQALQDVELSVPGGRVTGLIGPNGAGKTTMFNVITGLQPPNDGRVLLDGKDITKLRPAKRAKLGLARTFQRLELFGSLTTRENVQMAAETQRSKLPQRVTPLEQTERLIDKVGLRSVADVPTDALPTGQARLVELARALATSPDLLLLDEPSAGLDHEETMELGRLLTGLAGDGIGVLLVEHDMSLVMGVCDNVTVLDFGEVIASGEPAKVKADPAVQAAYLGAEESHESSSASEAPPAAAPSAAGATAQGSGGGATASTEDVGGRPSEDGAETKPLPPLGPEVTAGGGPASSGATAGAPAGQTNGKAAPADVDEAPMLLLEDVRASYGRIEVVHGVSLEIRRGSVTALLGPNGAGKSTTLKVACGTMQPSGGSVSFMGKPIRRTPPERLARQGLCTLPEGRAIFPNLSVAENLRMFTYRGRTVKLNDIEEKSFERFPILGRRRGQLAGRLSGGEQQMLALARALFCDPQILLLDELSMGLAPMVVGQLYEAVGSLVQREHLTVLLVEQFATTALSIADEACIMVTGEIVERGDPASVGERLTSSYLGADA